VPQAEGLDEVLVALGQSLDSVINIDSKEATLIMRLTGRRMCADCGANYHIITSPPVIEGVCDKCGGELYIRSDDNEETVRSRLQVYKNQTEPLIEYYRNKGLLKTVNGEQTVQEVFEDIRLLLEGETE
jgi:adenylate kinase